MLHLASINGIDIASLVISITSCVFASLSFILSLIVFNSQRKNNFEEMLFRQIKPIAKFISQSLIVRDGGDIPTDKEIRAIETELINGFEMLYVYGKAHNMLNLTEFATINKKYGAERCFAFHFFTIENEYKKLLIKLGDENETIKKDSEAYEEIGEYCIAFRKCLDWVEQYSKKLMARGEKRNLPYKAYEELKKYRKGIEQCKQKLKKGI